MKCQNIRYYLLWVLKQTGLCCDIQILIIKKYLQCYFPFAEVEDPIVYWNSLFNPMDRKWHYGIITDTTQEYGHHTLKECLYGLQGWEND